MALPVSLGVAVRAGRCWARGEGRCGAERGARLPGGAEPPRAGLCLRASRSLSHRLRKGERGCLVKWRDGPPRPNGLGAKEDTQTRACLGFPEEDPEGQVKAGRAASVLGQAGDAHGDILL